MVDLRVEEIMNDREHFGENDRRLGDVLVEDADLAFVGRVSDEGGENGE